MERKSIISILLFVTSILLVQAQSFSGKTNSINYNYTQPVGASTLPDISWTVPRIESSVSREQSMMIDANVVSEIPLKELKLVIENGGEVRERTYKLTENQLSYRIKQSLTFERGNNTITLVAENSKGGRVSSVRSILVGNEDIANAVDANRLDLALIFASDNYDNWDDLVNPISDATTIATILREKYGFQTELVLNATLEEITAKLYDYNTRKFNPQDQLFVFFAGHGYYDEVLGEGYVVASNSQKNDKGKTSYLSHSILRQRLENIQCEHIFLTMDVCFGGTFDPVLAKARAGEALDEATDNQYLVRKLTKRTRKYLTSGSKEYVSDGIAGRNSPFAAKFIQALREIGGGSGRILTLSELNTYFQKLPSEPRFGNFGTDDPASDFVFVAREK